MFIGDSEFILTTADRYADLNNEWHLTIRVGAYASDCACSSRLFRSSHNQDY